MARVQLALNVSDVDSAVGFYTKLFGVAPLTDEVVAAADVVITMGCGDKCPYVPGKRYEDWPIDDPDGKPAEQVAAIRDDIDRRVRDLVASLLPDLALPPAHT